MNEQLKHTQKEITHSFTYIETDSGQFADHTLKEMKWNEIIKSRENMKKKIGKNQCVCKCMHERTYMIVLKSVQQHSQFDFGIENLYKFERACTCFFLSSPNIICLVSISIVVDCLVWFLFFSFFFLTFIFISFHFFSSFDPNVYNITAQNCMLFILSFSLSFWYGSSNGHGGLDILDYCG